MIAALDDHELGGLQCQILILSLFWRTEIGNQGVSRAMAPSPLGENFFLPLLVLGGAWHSLAVGTTAVSVSAFTWPSSLCFCILKLPLF